MTANGYRIFFFLDDENVLKLHSGDDCTTLNIPETTELYTLKDAFCGTWNIYKDEVEHSVLL